MKKLIAILFFLTIANGLFAQDRRGILEGTIYLANDQTVRMNAELVQYLRDNIQRIVSIGGKTTVSIPIEKQFKRRLRTRIVNGFVVQYAYVGSAAPAVALQKPRTRYIEFDFKTKKTRETAANHDNDDPMKPTDAKLIAEVKRKDDQANLTPGALTPGAGKP
jgi:hypothetical protein